MEIKIVLLCGVFMLITAAISYYRMTKDFKEALKKKKERSK